MVTDAGMRIRVGEFSEWAGGPKAYSRGRQAGDKGSRLVSGPEVRKALCCEDPGGQSGQGPEEENGRYEKSWYAKQPRTQV